MRQNGNIQIQDPSASPTFGLSRPQAAPPADVSPSLRRNLFGSHLSRRPAPASTGTSDRVQDPFISANARDAPTASSLHQNTSQNTQRHSQRAVVNHSSHGPMQESRLSPTRSLSPVKPIYAPSSSSIIALDPTTGRPQLPVMPSLPPRLREDSEEEEDGNDGDVEQEEDQDDHAAAWRRVRDFERANSSHHDFELHSSSLVGMSSQPTRLHDLIDGSTSGADYRDYEKIESILSEMQSQQKARARSAVLPDLSSTELGDSGGGSVSARTRGKARTMARTQLPANYQAASDADHSQPRVGGVGASLKPEDKDELLSLIMTSLRKRIQEADEDAWMFGDERMAANGVSITGNFNIGRGDELDY